MQIQRQQCPARRERREDIPLLINAFINRLRLKTDKPIFSVSPAALELLSEYDWPGNIRELINALEYAFVLCPGEEILPAHLPRQLRKHSAPTVNAPLAPRRESPTMTKAALSEALAAASGNKSDAARRLGVSRVTFYKKIKRFGL